MYNQRRKNSNGEKQVLRNTDKLIRGRGIQVQLLIIYVKVQTLYCATYIEALTYLISDAVSDIAITAASN